MKVWMLLTAAMVVSNAVVAPLSAAEAKPTHPISPAIAPSCPEYIQSGNWVYRYSAEYPFNEWMLSLVPTACGRYIDATETAYMFYEVVKKFGQNEHWANNRGMINQLACHLDIAREKPEWNIEPWRPYVGYSTTKDAECNPLIPDADPAYH